MILEVLKVRLFWEESSQKPELSFRSNLGIFITAVKESKITLLTTGQTNESKKDRYWGKEYNFGQKESQLRRLQTNVSK